MSQPESNSVFPVFIVMWIALGIASSAFFFLNKNAALKRKVWPPFTIAVGLIFLSFVWWTTRGAEVLVFAGPMVALITFLNLRSVRFCDACGRTLMNQNPLSPPKFCSKCGAPLHK